MEHIIACFCVALAILLICCAVYFPMTDSTKEPINTHSDYKYCVKKITNNIDNTVTYRVCRREYHSHIGYVYTSLKDFDKEDLAMELTKKLITDGEKKVEILYVS